MNPAIGGTGSASHHRQRFRCKAVDPLVGGNWLSGFWIGSETRPIAFLLNLFVRDRTFDPQYEWFELPLLRQVPEFQEVVAVLISQHGIVQVHLGKPRDC